MPILIIPGLNDSGPAHWQTVMERKRPDASRVQQQDWARPSLESWLQNLRASIALKPHAILVAHSLGCPLVAHAVARHPDLPIKGIMLVAPADVESDCPKAELLRSFAPFPQVRFRCSSITVASADDPYICLNRASDLAAGWGSEFVDVGRSGHINVASGHGPWAAGDRILDSLVAKSDAVHQDSAETADLAAPRNHQVAM